MDRKKGVAWRLYEMIRDAADRKGMSDSDINRATGLSRKTLWNLPHQPNPPQRRTVVLLAETLGLDLEDALAASRGLEPEPKTVRVFEDPAAQAIWDLPLPESERAHLLQEYWSRLGSTEQGRRTG